MKTIYKTIIALGIILCLIFIFALKPILIPSYYSVVSACGYLDEEKLNEQGKFTAGKITVERYNQTNEIKNYTIEVFIEDEELKETIMKHELCHLRQAEQNRLYGCNHLILKFFNEVECYIIQNF
ncbi:MAG: hypothetical protein ACOCV1_00035 [Bacillota bacterium]